ncbi:hypothetical protein [Nitrospirillum pindoramense]|uniref:Uncharacterized protein n=1 Tax=Nitrospirillum amazonense TaxID=28077 RepID=A0A560HDD1_9PROT|nr:hypothetical protein [Nitrospirillum amazonense]TWB44407.1 hypothetical protein FBZ90_103314 [Nitrospirillum amazonense]
MTKRLKSIEFQRYLVLPPAMATLGQRPVAYAYRYDAARNDVDDQVREMFCDMVAEPLPADIQALLARLQGKERLN